MRLVGLVLPALSLLLAVESAAPQAQRSPQQALWRDATRLYDQQRFAEAELIFTRLAAPASPTRNPALAFLALSEYETGKYRESVRHFQEWASAKAPGTQELAALARTKWAFLLTRAGVFDQATYLLSLNASPELRDPLLVEGLGLAALRIRALPEEYPAADREPVYLAGRAAFEAALHRSDRAEAWALKLLPHFDTRPGVHYFLGTLFLAGNNGQAASSEFEKELRTSPDHVDALLQVAILRIDAGNVPQAASFAERAVVLAPGYFPARNVLGRAYFQLKRYPESVKELEVAKSLAPANAQVRFFLSKAYAAVGRSADAARERTVFAQFQERDHRQHEVEAGAR